MRLLFWFLGIVLISAAGVFLAAYIAEPEYAYVPPLDKVANPKRINQAVAYDVWGRSITSAEAEKLKQKQEGVALLTPENGAVEVDQALLDLGRASFYRETFGNEVFLSEVMGVLDGPFNFWSIAAAVVRLGGQGTNNLQIELREDLIVGGKTFPKGSKLDTGIDVVPGTLIPIGVKMKFSEGRLVAGITCALCHTTLDPGSQKVVEGGMNSDFNGGLILALASNSAAYFGHSNVHPLNSLPGDPTRTVVTTTGRTVHLPDPAAMERAVDADLVKWPPGTFDATTDLESNPAKINNTFTLGDDPYAWTGVFPAGPFKGLTAISNHVHAIGSDGLSQSASSHFLMDVDKEVYVGTILQNAARAKYRYDPKRDQKPSEFWARVNPRPASVGSNEIVPFPTFPNTSLMSEVGLAGSSPGYRFLEQNNALAAFQDSLAPPLAPIAADHAKEIRGRAVFEKAGCIGCHAGSALTRNRVVSVSEIGTEPSRAKALKGTEPYYVAATTYSFDTPVPLPPNPKVLPVPTDGIDPQQIRIAYAYGGTDGGYKVPSLIGLYWTAPYLHDGAIAVGSDLDNQLGLPGTLLRGIRPDPINSLKALFDHDLRSRVIVANQRVKDLQTVHVQGIGHEYWVDGSRGFSRDDQDALAHYLLTVSGDPTMVTRADQGSAQ